MPNWVSKILSGGFADLADQIMKRVPGLQGPEKREFELALEQVLQQRESELETTIRAELKAKETILIAELGQDDRYTKRARPTVVYAGLLYVLLIIIFHYIGEINGRVYTPPQLPTEFWWAWGGICTTWVIGRTAEKRGTRNKWTAAITGNGNGPLS
jgi:hypothetical protein